ncbi:hypothetical protein BVG79_01780 [Ketogulonicigenium robustum]|uniref:Uncharacterized protein n=1 Tax=Ketogulonicigenium robustum TaxID=92947 RepID=A0A1W6P107_9RHOB|nr:hypothetical protein [Ketogulonicigenium robustum]ARO15124.1 hypothetical protein BVG79_01780 [Ketogulonicigenium robustum]
MRWGWAVLSSFAMPAVVLAVLGAGTLWLVLGRDPAEPVRDADVAVNLCAIDPEIAPDLGAQAVVVHAGPAGVPIAGFDGQGGLDYCAPSPPWARGAL